MSKKANPTTLGLFIVIGLGLAVAGIVAFSSWKLFGKTEKCILYFDASLTGLSPGAPVRFRGVTVGSVSEMLIHHNQAPDDRSMPVIVEIDESLIRKKTDRSLSLSEDAPFQRLLAGGMRGLLQAQSLVTGVLYVELDILPHAPPATFHQIKKEFKEIPTVPTKIEALIDKLADLDFKQLTDQLASVLTRLDSSLQAVNVSEISAGLTNLLTSVNQFVRSPDLTNSLASFHRTLDEYRLLSETMRLKIDPLAKGADDTLKEAQITLVELRKGAQNLRDLLAPQAPMRRDLAVTLDELAEAARSVGALADFLNRNPNALISGRKQRPESQP
jgi:paraquat-inducible protein B